MIAEDSRRNPYIGLRPYGQDDALYFFGRREPVDDLLDTLREHHILGLVGSPGSGKSSLMNAGLLPAMLGGFLVDDRDRWRRATATPGDTPLANLAAGLLAAMDDAATPEAVAYLAARLRRGGSRAALAYLEPRLEPNANLALLVDDFEAIFAFRDGQADDAVAVADRDWARRDSTPEGRAARRERARRKEEASVFAEVLMGLGEQRQLPVYVAITMRAGFLGHCDLFNGLPEVFNRSRYLVPRMTREQLRDAVECPALLVNVHIAPRLVDLVLNELGDSFDRLPVLHHALMRSFDEWEKDGRTGPIDLPHFERAGGFDGAIAKDADNAIRTFSPPAVDAVLRRLVDTAPDGCRCTSARSSATPACPRRPSPRSLPHWSPTDAIFYGSATASAPRRQATPLVLTMSSRLAALRWARPRLRTALAAGRLQVPSCQRATARRPATRESRSPMKASSGNGRASPSWRGPRPMTAIPGCGWRCAPANGSAARCRSSRGPSCGAPSAGGTAGARPPSGRGVIPFRRAVSS